MGPHQLAEREGRRSSRDRSSPIGPISSQDLDHIDLFLELDTLSRQTAYRIDCLAYSEASGLVAHWHKTSDGCLSVTDRNSPSAAHLCKVRAQLRLQFRNFHDLRHDLIRPHMVLKLQDDREPVVDSERLAGTGARRWGWSWGRGDGCCASMIHGWGGTCHTETSEAPQATARLSRDAPEVCPFQVHRSVPFSLPLRPGRPTAPAASSTAGSCSAVSCKRTETKRSPNPRWR